MRRWPIVIVVLGLALAGAAAYAVPYLRLATNGAGFSADLICACLFVSGRSLESCRTDFDPAANSMVSLRIGKDDVSAFVPLIARRTARFEPGFGCSLTE